MKNLNGTWDEEKDKRLVMVIDQRRCIGCHTCAIACTIENNAPKNTPINKVITDNGGLNMDTPSGAVLGADTTAGTFNNPVVKMAYYTRACQHCDEHPCVDVCPTQATFVNEGAIEMDYGKCIDCGNCIAACPYTGSKNGDMRVSYRDKEWYTDFDLGDPASPKRYDAAAGYRIVSKCTFCQHLRKKGEKPACVSVCPGRARFVGDINNTGSEVYQLVYGVDPRGNTREYATISELENIDRKNAGNPAVYILKP
jgi:molybdopterin-containing oxidoreductase family iron-sulfur binding subunit